MDILDDDPTSRTIGDQELQLNVVQSSTLSPPYSGLSSLTPSNPGTGSQLHFHNPTTTSPRMFENTISTSTTIPVTNNGHQEETILNAQLNCIANDERKFSGPIQDGMITSVNQDIDDNAIYMNIKPEITSQLGAGDKNIDNKDAQKVKNSSGSKWRKRRSKPKDRKFTCPFCNRCFNYQHVLKNHLRIHTGERPYACKICGDAFKRDHHLETHMRLHSGERPYNCVQCSKTFVQVANLRRHLQVHSGERPYLCHLCPSRYADLDQLTSHMFMHSDKGQSQKPHFCESCGKRFTRPEGLVQHMVVHMTYKQLSPSEMSPPSSNKGKRKTQKIRKIIQAAVLLASAAINTSNLPVPVYPEEQTQPEDLSLGTGHFSDIDSSVISSSESAKLIPPDEVKMETSDSFDSPSNLKGDKDCHLEMGNRAGIGSGTETDVERRTTQ